MLFTLAPVLFRSLVSTGAFLYAKIHSGDSYHMPTLNWIGKDAVVDHYRQAPFRLWMSNQVAGLHDK